MMALVATPLLFLQVWVGSFSGRSCLGVWKAVPLLKGLGVVQLALSCVQAFYYLITGSLAFYYVGQVIASGDTAFEDCLVSQPRAESCQVSQQESYENVCRVSVQNIFWHLSVLFSPQLYWKL